MQFRLQKAIIKGHEFYKKKNRCPRARGKYWSKASGLTSPFSG